MYLRLYNGRVHPEEELDDWGLEGPTFEIEWVQWTYGYISRIKFKGDTEESTVNFRQMEYFIYKGIYYGDFMVENQPDSNLKMFKLKHYGE